MGEIIKATFGSKARADKNQRSSLCRHGHHQWKIEKETQFDVKKGKLVTVSQCQRCGKTKVHSA